MRILLIIVNCGTPFATFGKRRDSEAGWTRRRKRKSDALMTEGGGEKNMLGRESTCE